MMSKALVGGTGAGVSVYIRPTIFGNLVFLKTPGSNDLLTLHPVDGAVDPEAGGLQHIGFSISPEDHEAAVAEAKAFGAEVVDISEPGRDRRPYVYIKDPDGYVIELS